MDQRVGHTKWQLLQNALVMGWGGQWAADDACLLPMSGCAWESHRLWPDARWEGNRDAVTTPLSALGDSDFNGFGTSTSHLKFVPGSPGAPARTSGLSTSHRGQVADDPSAVPVPVRYEVDDVRVFQAR